MIVTAESKAMMISYVYSWRDCTESTLSKILTDH